MKTIKLWQESGLNQSAFCKRNNLKPFQLSYWYNRLAKTEIHQQEPSKFIPVSTESSESKKLNPLSTGQLKIKEKEITLDHIDFQTILQILEVHS